MPYTPPPDLAHLDAAQIAALVAARRLPPVDQWNPAKCSDSKMRIDARGRWFHDDGEIKRPAMIRAFSSLLRKEANGHFVLVTPFERQSITVEDAPFIAVELQAIDGAQLAFRLNTDDLVVAGPDHPLRFCDMETHPRAYLHVRGGLEARLNRPTYYQLVELALASGHEPPSVFSNGIAFPLTTAAA